MFPTLKLLQLQWRKIWLRIMWELNVCIARALRTFKLDDNEKKRVNIIVIFLSYRKRKFPLWKYYILCLYTLWSNRSIYKENIYSSLVYIYIYIYFFLFIFYFRRHCNGTKRKIIKRIKLFAHRWKESDSI